MQEYIDHSLKVLIYLRDETPNKNSHKVVNWFRNHDIEPIVVKYNDIITVTSNTIIISDDMIPSPTAVNHIIRNNYFSSNFVFHINSENNFTPSLFTFFEIEESKTLKLSELIFEIIHGENHYMENLFVKFDSLEIKDNSTHKLNMGLAEKLNLEQLLNFFKAIISDYWHKVSNDIVSQYYFHRLILAYQKLCVRTQDIYGNFHESLVPLGEFIRSQSFFVGYVPQTLDKTKNLDWVIHKVLKAKIPLGVFPKGVTVNVNLTNFMLKSHPLNLPGMYQVKSGIEEDEYDTSVTVVGFFYSVGYQQKPKEDYFKSFQTWVSVKHPIVFFGEKETCEYLQKLRGNPEFTKIIIKPANEWKLIKDYEKEFITKDRPEKINQSKCYSILTNLKVEAMKEASILNIFNSDKLIWHDPGMFKHKHMITMFQLGTPYFRNVEVIPGKISVCSTTNVISSTHEELLNSKESILSYMMAGDRETWIKFHKESDSFLRSLFAQNIFRTEQIIHTRICTLKPNMFNLLSGSYAQHNKCIYKGT